MSAEKIELPLRYVDPEGRVWNLYSVVIPTTDGVYSTYLYAVSFLHAQLLLDDLKIGGYVDGQIAGVTKA